MFQKGRKNPPQKITDYQSANVGAVAEATQPEIYQTVVEDATKLISNPEGRLNFLDIDGNANSIVGSDNNSNEALTIINAGLYDILMVGVSTTVWWVSGIVSSDTAPTFTD